MQIQSVPFSWFSPYLQASSNEKNDAFFQNTCYMKY